MKVAQEGRATYSSLFRVLSLIGLALLKPVHVHSWAPAKSLSRHRPNKLKNRFCSSLRSFKGETENGPWANDGFRRSSIPTKRRDSTSNGRTLLLQELELIIRLFFACIGMSIILISWEDISMYHPMRIESSTSLATTSSRDSTSLTIPPKSLLRWGRSTVRGLASGVTERQAISAAGDLESTTYKNLPSYNEVMLTHRTDRIPLWSKDVLVQKTSRNDVVDSVRAIQMALLRIQDSQELARNYEWDELTESLNDKILRSDLQNACYILKGADEFLSREARDEIGFDWGSCAWRHCGALSDAQEAIDALEHQIGMLEPFECVYCLDVVERSLRDMLAVTSKYADTSLKIPDYVPIQRMSDLSNQEDDGLDRQDAEYMDALSILRNSEF
mmetsp:Transcript_14132/g.32891  ORF Transcript_14132/g.32891 Transcript_14132/m.32891 type:complete len:388 (-) Transcript_14132:417-1580(-)|eukprot:CAMPEP_0197190700 /NCGR_PEP_ID=MMETSP1423-20130617/22169_1 /TAXON_ID=476441 /ORGANISM="Pseudo-nitzschia heimii, Strain UNC1101" /LENGTH=387 /DNA_ID=CAMNT_0042643147 /DNA_START=70 /DNA_END=1233 /DNA_ORIENTATION=+